MSQTWVAGYELAITIDTDTIIGLTASSYTSEQGPAFLAKPTFGAAAQGGLAGQSTGSMSASGHSTVEAMPALQALRASKTASAFSVVLGGAGTEAYDAIVGSVELSADADGELDWSFSGDIVGGITYTSPT